LYSGGTQGLPLSDLPSILPTADICDAHSTIKTSFEFHRNRVFGRWLSYNEETNIVIIIIIVVPIDKPSVHKSSAKQQANFDTSLVEELNSLDIRTQMILKRFRVNILTLYNLMLGRLRELIDKFSEEIPDIETVKGK